MDIRDFLNFKLFKIGGEDIEVSSILMAFLIVVGIWAVLTVLRKLIYKNQKFDESKKFTLYSLLKYVIIIFGFVICLDVVGLNVSLFMAGSAALLVGIGLGLQNLFSDFVSGIILLLDASIKVGDIIQIDDMVCRVKEIRMRTTTVQSRDDKMIIVPNSVLTKNQIINWTYDLTNSRFKIDVGVAYGSNAKTVMDILLDLTKQHPKVEQTPAPFVRLSEFGDSSVVFTVIFWTADVFGVETLKSDLRIKYFEAFNEKGIEIPFPQRVVHYVNAPGMQPDMENKKEG